MGSNISGPSTRQQGWYISGTLRKQFPYITVQLILSLSKMVLMISLQEHKSKYIYLLAYASSVCDTWNYKRNTRFVLAGYRDRTIRDRDSFVDSDASIH